MCDNRLALPIQIVHVQPKHVPARTPSTESYFRMAPTFSPFKLAQAPSPKPQTENNRTGDQYGEEMAETWVLRLASKDWPFLLSPHIHIWIAHHNAVSLSLPPTILSQFPSSVLWPRIHTQNIHHPAMNQHSFTPHTPHPPPTLSSNSPVLFPLPRHPPPKHHSENAVRPHVNHKPQTPPRCRSLIRLGKGEAGRWPGVGGFRKGEGGGEQSDGISQQKVDGVLGGGGEGGEGKGW